MEKIHLAILVPSLLISQMASGAKREVITKENLSQSTTGLRVSSYKGKSSDWRVYEITIPKDDPRLHLLRSASFIVRQEDESNGLAMRVPMEIRKMPDGSKRLWLGASEAQFNRSFIELEYHWADPKLSSLDILWVDLVSFFDDTWEEAIKKAEAKKKKEGK